MKHLLLIFALALTALGQTSVTTVNTMAELVGLVPISTRPHVRVLGGASINDGAGGDYVWVAASTAATNAINSIAYPYGSAAGRWLKLVQGAPFLDDATLQGNSTVPSGATFTLADGAFLVAPDGATVTLHDAYITKPPFTGTATEPATVQEVTIRSVSIATDLVALKALTVNTTVNRMAVVRENTVTSDISDNAVGFWLWDPASTAAESPVVQKSSTFASGDPGRWLKL